ncbi:hypothetical protein [Dyadobacter sp. CY347]|uniref:hypothetical protein n=1 Tax=Dyadobacter sp. CY347 TaxID=2909336 RepID=UPI001F227322|nr:hypothetical protein [Dyadobacter sp. CY347]MCF2487477.1 hypothetical protein [Dyadobacter sp. CY347]
MKILFTFLFQLLLFSCSRKGEGAHYEPDPIGTSAEILSKYSVPDSSNDSVAFKRAKVALPGVNFGISTDEYGNASSYILQGLGANTYFVKPLFNKNAQLYKIEISGLSQKAHNLDDKLADDHKNLVSFLESQNGRLIKIGSYPKERDLKPGEVKWTHSWASHSKQVKVGIAEESLGGTFEVVAWIFDQSMIEQEQLADSASHKRRRRTVR